MERRKFLAAVGLTAITPFAMQLQNFKKTVDGFSSTEKMPVLFVGHGSPMNAIEQNEYSAKWKEIGNSLTTKPQAILCVSAHWQTFGTKVTMMEKPKTIHDFGGFPQSLFDVEYPAPGSPAFAKQAKELITTTEVRDDFEWGLDHGCWSVLNPMFPSADIPVFQLSMDYRMTPQQHYDLGKQLYALRSRGVLIMGSGNIVHNLGMVQWSESAFEWAKEFDEKIKSLIDSGDHNSIIHYENLGAAAKLSIPTNEHYLPLLYSLALQDAQDCTEYFNDKTTMGSISMRSVKISS